ncbi:TonB C-terminal domain-containing protein [Luteimonas sp. Y-2-2-4F]|nr:TonB family protein [Luteimonas sp. Y-2-2-4F]MCD9033820.1 TonB C-terminal domain-containing protein [Luteimonas sp. Y-2-2-4F]
MRAAVRRSPVLARCAALALCGLSWAASAAGPSPAQAEWVRRVHEHVVSRWSLPPGAKVGTGCRVQAKLSRSGEVESAEIREPCGDAMLERSVRAAVLRASPLPLPRDPAAFDPVLVIHFKVR